MSTLRYKIDVGLKCPRGVGVGGRNEEEAHKMPAATSREHFHLPSPFFLSYLFI